MVATRRDGRSNARPMPLLGAFRSPLVAFSRAEGATEASPDETYKERDERSAPPTGLCERQATSLRDRDNHSAPFFPAAPDRGVRGGQRAYAAADGRRRALVGLSRQRSASYDDERSRLEVSTGDG
jgi:hypothetical protein